MGDNLICGKMIDNPNYGYSNFDSFGSAFFQVFQTVTLEDWSEISDAVSKTSS